MGNISYKNLKVLIKSFMKKNTLSSTVPLCITSLSESTIKAGLGKLKKANIITKTTKESNTYDSELIDRTFYNSVEQNAAILSSLITNEKDNSKTSFSYLFKEVPKNVSKAISHDYTKRFDKDILELMDNNKYKFFVFHIANLGSTEKPILEIESIYGDKAKIVPLDMFISDHTWYLVAYNVNSKYLTTYNLHNTKKSKVITSETFKKYISKSEIDNFINTSVGINNKDTYFIKTTTEALMILIASNLMDDYEIFMEDEEITEKISSYIESIGTNSMKRMNFSDEQTFTTEHLENLIPVNLQSVSNYDTSDFNKEYTFETYVQKRLIIKITSSSKNKRIILEKFKKSLCFLTEAAEPKNNNQGKY